MSPPRVVVIGAGPTGLGAAHRLQELGHEDYVVLEAADYVGGLATSFTDPAGFTYDIGGHVMFSHYPVWDALVDKLMGDEYTELQREAWVWTEDRYIPYPFQNNIRHLDKQTVYECVVGLVEAQRANGSYSNFREWVDAVHGVGIAKHFMIPYNFKVWATPAELMNFVWIGERVSVVDSAAVLRNVILGEDNRSWGPNNTFRYPEKGGTGTIWQRLAADVGESIQLETRVVSIDVDRRVATTDDGTEHPYDRLISTMPLTHLVGVIDQSPEHLRAAAGDLVASGSHIVGVGIDRPTVTSKNWIYYPEPDVPFYRVTYLSNYSPYMTANPAQTLLLTETSTSDFKHEDPTTIVERVIDGLERVGLLEDGDRDRIVTTWLHSPELSYPVPSVGRDAALGAIQPWLRSHDIWSRGRFGGWLYEIGNMDHSVMQGIEAVDAAVLGKPETVWIARGEGAAGEGIR